MRSVGFARRDIWTVSVAGCSEPESVSRRRRATCEFFALAAPMQLLGLISVQGGESALDEQCYRNCEDHTRNAEHDPAG
jgi:hypothetical protein